MTTIADYRRFVEAGAKLLDQRNPGWADLIDLGTLDVHSYERCVLAQVYRSSRFDIGFSDGLDELFGRPRNWDDVIIHGFDHDTAYPLDLTPLWQDEIVKRLEAK